MLEEESSQQLDQPNKGAEKKEDTLNALESTHEDSITTQQVESSLSTQQPSKDSEPFNEFIAIAVKELEDKKAELLKEISDLSQRKTQLEKGLENSFDGQSDAIARKVKGFQDYLTGALQNLAQSAEQLELVVQPVVVQPSPLDKAQESNSIDNTTQNIPAVADTFKPDEELIRSCLDQFLGQPDFYAESWKLRRSLEKKDIELLEDWFFSMGGERRSA